MSEGTQTKGEGALTEIDYELVIDADDGSVMLTCGGEMMWASVGDEAYQREFGTDPVDIDDSDEIEDIFDWLVSQGYAPPGVEYDVCSSDDVTP